MSKFNIGDKVRYIGDDHDNAPEYYPSRGTIGTIINQSNECDNVYVQWEKGSTSKKDCWYCNENDIELFENVDMTNEEIWEMLRPKMEKNFLLNENYRVGSCGFVPTYDCDGVHNAIAIAYRSGYERAMKGRPFKFGEKKKKGGHWEPVDPNNLPKEGTKVKLKKEYINYYGGMVEPGETGIVFHGASYVTRVLGYGINFGKHKTVFLPLDRNIIANCLDMWVEDDE